MRKPSKSPRPTAATKPINVVTSVCRAWNAIGPAVCTIVRTMPLGAGSTICWIWSAGTATSQTTTSPAKTVSGRTSRRRCGLTPRLAGSA
jgi:hypothetical protein